MSQPAGPPPYDAIYSQGIQTHPVQTHPMQTHPVQIQPQPQGTYIIQPQAHIVVSSGGSLAVATADGPTVVVCQTCNTMIRTNTVMTPACRTHLCAFLLCACGLWPCCPIPYCIPGCNNVDHFCPNCQSYIGSFKG